MIFPVGGYNPMGKELALEKVRVLMVLGTEDLVQQESSRINQKFPSQALSYTPFGKKQFDGFYYAQHLASHG